MANETVTAPKGFKAAAMSVGIKASGKPDLAMLVSDNTANAAAVFTSNKVVGAPVIVGRKHILKHKLRACVVNSGCANVCTGERGVQDAEEMCRLASEQLQTAERPVPLHEILPASTGVIGHFLPMDKIRAGVPKVAARLSSSEESGLEFATGIMTTDLKVKMAYTTAMLNGKKATFAGAAKGSGMIAPNMATMLAYVTTDAQINPIGLMQMTKAVAKETFNCVTVDQHTSTSDTFVVLANGMAENRTVVIASQAAKAFRAALFEICDSLARQIAADGEGATKLVRVKILGAFRPLDAENAAKAIANSPLVKTAIHGGDPNWGRFVSAVGYSGARIKNESMSCKVGAIEVFKGGRPTEVNLVDVQAAMKGPEVEITVDLGFPSKYTHRMYTCDLTREYITINADYHT